MHLQGLYSALLYNCQDRQRSQLTEIHREVELRKVELVGQVIDEVAQDANARFGLLAGSTGKGCPLPQRGLGGHIGIRY
jgi:hypothetical protein